MQFFDNRTSKSAPNLFFFFDLHICFAPQRRDIFQHLNFKKLSNHGVFCTFWLAKVLCGTAACPLSTSELPKAVRRWSVLDILTWKGTSCRSGVQFLISPLTTWLRTRRFSEPTFRPTGTTNHWENTTICDFPHTSQTCIFLLLTFAQMYSVFQLTFFWLYFPALLFISPYCRKFELLNFFRSTSFLFASWFEVDSPRARHLSNSLFGIAARRSSLFVGGEGCWVWNGIFPIWRWRTNISSFFLGVEMYFTPPVVWIWEKNPTDLVSWRGSATLSVCWNFCSQINDIFLKHRYFSWKLDCHWSLALLSYHVMSQKNTKNKMQPTIFLIFFLGAIQHKNNTQKSQMNSSQDYLPPWDRKGASFTLRSFFHIFMVKQFGSMKRLLGQLSAWCGVVGLTTALMVGLEDGKVESYGGMWCLDTPNVRAKREVANLNHQLFQG